MTFYQRVVLTAIADFVMAAGGWLAGAMVQQGQVILPNTAVLILAAVTGAVAAFSHIKASLAEPPKA